MGISPEPVASRDVLTGPTNLDELLAWTSRRLPGRECRLARFDRVLARFTAEHPTLFPVVKVAGTNGKGSVAAMLSAAARGDGRRVGLFTSPHLLSFTERVRVGDEDVAVGALDAAVRRLAPFLRRLEDEGGRALVPSFFETMILLALIVFDDCAVDLAVFEAAIGGRSDAVSLVPGPLAAVTSVALDHTDELGGSLVAIATDKAGIATEGSRLVLGPGIVDDARAAIDSLSRTRRVELCLSPVGDIVSRSLGADGHEVRVWSAGGSVSFRLPLAGAHQIENLAVVLGLVRELVALNLISGEECIAGVAGTRWPARLERVPGTPEWLLDSAHNPSALAALGATLPAICGGRTPTLLYGATEGHDLAACLALLPRLCRSVHLIDGFHRSVSVEVLRAQLPPGIDVVATHASVGDAARAARARYRSSDDLVLAVGSMYMVGALRDLLTSPRTADDGRLPVRRGHP